MVATTYQLYLDGLNMTSKKAYGQCKEVCLKMQKVFPELELVKGHYFCASWGSRMHWWLVSRTGTIIDPTKLQFPSQGNGVYDPLDETAPQPTGKCPNCGEYIFDNRYVHEECQDAWMASLK